MPLTRVSWSGAEYDCASNYHQRTRWRYMQWMSCLMRWTIRSNENNKNNLRLHMFTDELLDSWNITSHTGTLSNSHLVLALAEVECLSRDPELDFISYVSWWYGIPWFPKLVSTTWERRAGIRNLVNLLIFHISRRLVHMFCMLA